MILVNRPIPPFAASDDIACKDVNPEIFFPPRYRKTAILRAQKICKTCPFIQECLTWAIDHEEPEGIWGGLGPYQRQQEMNAR